MALSKYRRDVLVLNSKSVPKSVDVALKKFEETRKEILLFSSLDYFLARRGVAFARSSPRLEIPPLGREAAKKKRCGGGEQRKDEEGKRRKAAEEGRILRDETKPPLLSSSS